MAPPAVAKPRILELPNNSILTFLQKTEKVARAGVIRDKATCDPSMLPRRGYEPVDDAEDDAMRAEAGTNGGGGGGGSAHYTSIPTIAASTSDRRREQGATSSSRGEDSIARTSGTAAGAVAGAAFNGHGSGGGAAEGGMTVRILDVKGQIYSLVVRPEITVHELKTRLVEEAGVEIARQRIIYGGKVRGTRKV